MKNIHAYIDAANLHRGAHALGWKINYRKFRGWLRQKYGVTKAYVFIGRIARNEPLYAKLRADGYDLVFKEVVFSAEGVPKGNCDADLVLQAAKEHFELGVVDAVLVSSDGDYASLVRFFFEKKGLMRVVSPALENKCSVLLKRTGAPILVLNDVRHKVGTIAEKEKAPGADVSAQGSSS